MTDEWLNKQCDEAFKEANHMLSIWQNAPKRSKKKAWFAFQMAEERQKMMRIAAISAEGRS